ncbi:MAG: AI-2E family transporter [Rhodoblastus sp.]
MNGDRKSRERPPEDHGDVDWSGRLTIGARVSAIGLFGLGLLFTLHEASSLLAPMIAAIVVGIVLSRIGERAQGLGVPRFVSAALFVIAAGAGIVLAAGALSSRVASLIDRAPEMLAKLNAIAMNLLRPLLALKSQIFGGSNHAEIPAPSFDMSSVSGVLGGLTPALSGFLIFLATLFFFMAGRGDLRRKIVFAYASREHRLSALRILNGVEEALALYFGSAALVYGALAILTAIVAWIGDLGPPMLWATFVFAMCFVPFLGVALVTAALLAAGFSTYDGFLAAIAPGAFYLIAHMALENAALPAIVGRRFEINPFLVFISIVFWTWMWGALGAVIASPMLLILKIVVEELRAVDKPELPA